MQVITEFSWNIPYDEYIRTLIAIGLIVGYMIGGENFIKWIFLRLGAGWLIFVIVSFLWTLCKHWR